MVVNCTARRQWKQNIRHKLTTFKFSFDLFRLEDREIGTRWPKWIILTHNIHIVQGQCRLNLEGSSKEIDGLCECHCFPLANYYLPVFQYYCCKVHYCVLFIINPQTHRPSRYPLYSDATGLQVKYCEVFFQRAQVLTTPNVDFLMKFQGIHSMQILSDISNRSTVDQEVEAIQQIDDSISI